MWPNVDVMLDSSGGSRLVDEQKLEVQRLLTIRWVVQGEKWRAGARSAMLLCGRADARRGYGCGRGRDRAARRQHDRTMTPGRHWAQRAPRSMTSSWPDWAGRQSFSPAQLNVQRTSWSSRVPARVQPGPAMNLVNSCWTCVGSPVPGAGSHASVVHDVIWLPTAGSARISNKQDKGRRRGRHA